MPGENSSNPKKSSSSKMLVQAQVPSGTPPKTPTSRWHWMMAHYENIQRQLANAATMNQQQQQPNVHTDTVGDERVMVNRVWDAPDPKEKLKYKAHLSHSPVNLYRYNETRHRDFNKGLEEAMFKLDCWWIDGGFEGERELTEDSEEEEEVLLSGSGWNEETESESVTEVEDDGTDDPVEEFDDPEDPIIEIINQHRPQPYGVRDSFKAGEEEDERTEEATLISEDSTRAGMGSSCEAYTADNFPMGQFDEAEDDEVMRVVRDVLDELVTRVDKAHTAIRLTRDRMKQERREVRRKERELLLQRQQQQLHQEPTTTAPHGP